MIVTRGFVVFSLAVGCLAVGVSAASCGDASSDGGSDGVSSGTDAGSSGDDGGNDPSDGGGSVTQDGSAIDAGTPPLGPPRIYVGSGDGKVRSFDFDLDAGTVTPRATTPAGQNPSFLAIDPGSHFLYAVDETASQVNAFSIDPGTGALTSLGPAIGSGGTGPAHLSVDHAGRFVLVANYGSGTIAVFPRGQDGRLGAAVASRSFGGSAMTHEIVADPSNTFLFVPNKGLDSVATFHFASDGSLSDAGSTPAGDGARHVAFDVSGHRVYVIDENASTLFLFTFDATTASLQKVQTISSLPPGFSGANTGAEVQLTPDGKHLVASNRGDDSLTIFDVAAATGSLTYVTRVSSGGKTPRHFSIEPTGRFLFVANQDSDTIVVMRVDPVTGIPQAATAAPPVSVPAPAFVGLVYLPAP